MTRKKQLTPEMKAFITDNPTMGNTEISRLKGWPIDPIKQFRFRERMRVQDSYDPRTREVEINFDNCPITGLKYF